MGRVIVGRVIVGRVNGNPLQHRRESYIIIYMWKIRHSLSPNDLQISFPENNFRLGPLAVIPRLHTSSRAKFQTLYDNSFAVVGPKLWNILPTM